RGALLKVLLGEQPDRNTIGYTATTPRALTSARLGDGLNGQALHLGGLGEPRNTGGSRVNDVPDPRNRQRGLGNVGGQNNAAVTLCLEHPVLLGRGEPCVQRQDFGVTRSPGVIGTAAKVA